MKSFQLLIKPVSFNCNLNCKYCFYLRVSEIYGKEKARMGSEILEILTAKYLNFKFKESIFGWQGGEPTLAGLNFYKKAIRLQQKYGSPGQIIGNALQTNGILINDEWAEFFNKYKFLIGLSLDGPKKIHDKYRLSIGGKSIWHKVMKAAEILRENKVSFNILCVVSKANVNHVKELYNFFLENDFRYLQFIPALEADENGNRAPFSISPEQYGKFLKELFALWSKNPGAMSIRMFDAILARLLNKPMGFCTFEEKCPDYMVIEWNGDVYPCDFFVKKDYFLGNIKKDSFSVIKNRRDNKFGKLKVKIAEDCVKCRWRDLCFGGCVKDRIFPANQQPQKSYFCQAYKIFFDFSIKSFQNLSKKV
ncbi:MAG: anaerobic sulfatase maturase [Promethearchaeia archaeon]